MTEEQRPLRAYQPWTDLEYDIVERERAKKVGVNTLAKGLSRYPSEVERALERLRIYNEKIAKRNEAVEHRQAIKNFPERLIAKYGSGLRPLDAVLKPKTTLRDLAEIEKRVWNKPVTDYLLRKARRLILNGKNYDTLLRKARERVHLQIEISATLAGGK